MSFRGASDRKEEEEWGLGPGHGPQGRTRALSVWVGGCPADAGGTTEDVDPGGPTQGTTEAWIMNVKSLKAGPALALPKHQTLSPGEVLLSQKKERPVDPEARIHFPCGGHTMWFSVGCGDA